jgi:regulatory protein NPR1
MTTDSDHASSGICFADPTSSHFPAASPGGTTGPDADGEALKHLSDNLRSMFHSLDLAFCSDATITCQSRDIPVHRCVLSARSPFFRDFFSKNREKSDPIEARDLLGDFKVGYEALVLVMEYLYSGRVGQLPKGVCICADETCLHAGCRPAVNFMVEVLYASFTFNIFELVSLFQVCFHYVFIVLFLFWLLVDLFGQSDLILMEIHISYWVMFWAE